MVKLRCIGSDSKCGFGRDCGFGRGREKLLKCGNRVPYRIENAVRLTQKPFQCGRFVADRPHFESLYRWTWGVSRNLFENNLYWWALLYRAKTWWTILPLMKILWWTLGWSIYECSCGVDFTLCKESLITSIPLWGFGNLGINCLFRHNMSESFSVKDLWDGTNVYNANLSKWVPS